MRIIDIDDLKKEHIENALLSEEHKTSKILAIEYFFNKLKNTLTPKIIKSTDSELLSALENQFIEIMDYFHSTTKSEKNQLYGKIKARIMEKISNAKNLEMFLSVLTEELFIDDTEGV